MEQGEHSDKVWLHYEGAIEAARILEAAGFEAYLIGGAVRDILLGHLPKDFDLVTDATPEQIAAIPELKNSKHVQPAQAFGVSIVTLQVEKEDVPLEITTYRRDIEAHLGRKETKVEFAHLEDDIARRDLTINALALDPFTHQLVDLVGGLDDLEQKIIRFIGEPEARIKEDPLRVLRAVRLRHQLGFSYEPATATALRQAVTAGATEQIAVERVRDELTRMLRGADRDLALLDLDELGILQRVLPEVKAMQNTPQPTELHAEGNVWNHTLLALRALEKPSARLAWATLLHDVGKPPTYQPAEQTHDRIRFNEHYRVGAELAEKILSRLRMSKRDIADISWMVHYHLSIDELPKMRPGKRYQMLGHPAFEDLLHLHKADAIATWHHSADGAIDTEPPRFPEIERLFATFREFQATPPPSLKQALGIDGHWLEQQFGLSGADLGSMLVELEEAWHDQAFSSEAEAKDYVVKAIKKAG